MWQQTVAGERDAELQYWPLKNILKRYEELTLAHWGLSISKSCLNTKMAFTGLQTVQPLTSMANEKQTKEQLSHADSEILKSSPSLYI